jgi:hypothetical protein
MTRAISATTKSALPTSTKYLLLWISVAVGHDG